MIFLPRTTTSAMAKKRAREADGQSAPQDASVDKMDEDSSDDDVGSLFHWTVHFMLTEIRILMLSTSSLSGSISTLKLISMESRLS